jgi:hypothetical protein
MWITKWVMTITNIAINSTNTVIFINSFIIIIFNFHSFSICKLRLCGTLAFIANLF